MGPADLLGWSAGHPHAPTGPRLICPRLSPHPSTRCLHKPLTPSRLLHILIPHIHLQLQLFDRRLAEAVSEGRAKALECEARQHVPFPTHFLHPPHLQVQFFDRRLAESVSEGRAKTLECEARQHELTLMRQQLEAAAGQLRRREGYLEKVEAGVIRPLNRWYQVRGGKGTWTRWRQA